MTDRDFSRAEECIGRQIQQQAILAEIYARQTLASREIAMRIELLKIRNGGRRG
ncbi:hypothetical protein [Roseixanthobacter pseudopolyaromaticivorans]|uniref:hypothetical protein n=1 Tax=Xanthobacteraceae TaxID=335928 RepID=UPI003728EF57